MPRGSRHLAEPTTFRHPETGRERIVTVKTDAISLYADGYRPVAELDGEVEPAEAVEVVLAPFDPSTKSVADVNAYLEQTAAQGDTDEVDRVIAAEAAGKNRATVRAPETTGSNVDSDE